MAKVYFSETQRFESIGIKILVILSSAGALVPLLVACYRQLILGELPETEGLSNLTLLLLVLGIIIMIVLVYLLIFGTQLEIRITSESINYRYRPFVYYWKTVTPDSLESATLRKYRAWIEYGGRGYKIRHLGRKGRALTIAGDQGLQLLFKNGSKLLIGTQRPEELRVALRRFLKEEVEND